jgi:Spy/CpxP family protein refolding chaperone
MRVARSVLVLAIALLVAASAVAQEKSERKGRGRGGDPIDRLTRGLTLTDDQKAKIADIKKEFTPKFAEVRKKREAILTDDQKKARDDAIQAARAEGKRGFEAMRAGIEAVTLTDDQKAKQKEVMKETADLNKQATDKVMDVLTDDQKAEVKKRMEEFKNKRKAKAAE